MSDTATTTPATGFGLAQATQLLDSLTVSTGVKDKMRRWLKSHDAYDLKEFSQALYKQLSLSADLTDQELRLTPEKFTGAGLDIGPMPTWMKVTLGAYMAAGAAGAAVVVAPAALAPTIAAATGATPAQIVAMGGATAASGATTAVVIGQGAMDDEAHAKEVSQEQAQAKADKNPLTPEQAAQAAQSGGTYEVTVRDPVTGVNRPVSGIDSMQAGVNAIVAGQQGSNTFTSDDARYMGMIEEASGLGTNIIKNQGKTLDSPILRMDDQLEPGVSPIRPDRRKPGVEYVDGKAVPARDLRSPLGPGPAGPNEWARTAKGWQQRKFYSYREAVRIPMDLTDDELMQWSKKLWEAGFIAFPQGTYDYTKPFEEQWVADRYDPTFRRAWNSLLETSLTDPTKSAAEIVEERRRKHLPMIEKQRQAEEEAKAKAALQRLNLPDPATLSETTEQKMQALLGRNPTAEERKTIMGMVTAQFAEQARQITDETSPITDVDYAARIEDAIQQTNPTEYGAMRVADQFDMFHKLLGGL